MPSCCLYSEVARLLQEDDSDMSLSRARGRHSPIVWNKDSDSGVKRPREPSAHEIAQAELEDFKRQRSGSLDGDPPAMKRSPSPSGSDHGGDLSFSFDCDAQA